MIRRFLLVIVIFGCGFVCAWLTLPAVVMREPAAPLVQRRSNSGVVDARKRAPASDAFHRFCEAAAGESVGEEWGDEFFSKLHPEEIPAVLALLKERAGLYGPNYDAIEKVHALLEYWFRTAPDAALAWLHQLPNKYDQEQYFGVFVGELAFRDLQAAIGLLHREAMNESGYVDIPTTLMEKAPALGADGLVAICRLGLNTGGSAGVSVFYPDDFDFARALNGLAGAQDEFGPDASFGSVPSNLISEWAKRDWKAAWAWVQQGRSINFNGSKEFFKAAASDEILGNRELGGMIASTLDPASDPENGYDNAWAALRARPSPELLDEFLRCAPGSQGVVLDGLFDNLGSGVLVGETEKAHIDALILERMTPAQRIAAIERMQVYFLSRESAQVYGAILRRLGHSDEEIRAIWPPARYPVDGSGW